jgi:hypothetical protein
MVRTTRDGFLTRIKLMCRKYRYSPSMKLLHSRLEREHRTLVRMTGIYCADHHARAPGAGLCPDCRSLMDYAERRLAKCPYGSEKPTCAKCPIHCYKADPRERVRTIMRYAGPRMTWRHPVLSLLHLLDKLRRVEHPMKRRRRTKASRPAK